MTTRARQTGVSINALRCYDERGLGELGWTSK
jgi:hypothetical protein